LFEGRLFKIRENAGYICDLLSLATALANGSYFRHGQTSQLAELQGMEKIPEGFIELYRDIIAEKSPKRQKELCLRIIKSTKSFLDGCKDEAQPEEKADFSELALWYHELSYTWRRVYYWCDQGDAVNAYVWGCMLQDEVEGTGKTFGITGIDILGSFDAGDLPRYKKRAESVEQVFIETIKKNGAVIDSYESVEAFLAKNA
jgi:hypothetical protein